MSINRFKKLIKEGNVGDFGDLSPLMVTITTNLRKLYLTITFFYQRGHLDLSKQLAFNTILAIVPIFAIIFAIGKGFGLAEYIEQSIKEALYAHPAAAETLIKLADSYLNHAQSGIFIGIGIIFMLYSVISLIRNIQDVFNSIWQVKDGIPFSRMIVEYTAMIFLTPIAIIVFSGLSIYLYGFSEQLKEYWVLSGLSDFAINYLLPFLIMSVAFLLLYIYMPNTKVKISKALIPACLAAISMLSLQALYIYGQGLLSSYNAIYGSLAALPLFMLWLQVSWTICLFFAELCYTNQNLEFFIYMIEYKDVSHKKRLMMCGIVLSYICQRFAEGNQPYTAIELKKVTNLPIRIVNDILYELRKIKLIAENDSPNIPLPTFSPTRDTSNITLGQMIALLESRERRRVKLLNFEPNAVFENQFIHLWEKEQQNYLLKLSTINIKDLAKAIPIDSSSSTAS